MRLNFLFHHFPGGREVLEVTGGNEVRFGKGRWLDFNLKAAKKALLVGFYYLGSFGL